MKTIALLASMQRPKPGPLKKRSDHPQAFFQSSGYAKTSGGIQIRKSLNIYDPDSDQSKNVKDWSSNGDVGDG